MYTIIGGDDREYGPVSAAQVEQWIAQRRANAQTRIKALGSATWGTLAEMPEFARALGLPPMPPPLPEPAAPVPELVAPAVAATPLPADPRAAAFACRTRPYELRVPEVLSRGWALLVGHFWLIVGSTTLVVAASSLVGAIPYAGAAALLLFALVPIAGLYRMLLRLHRGEPATAADLLAGFREALRPLVLLTVTLNVATRLLALLALAPLLRQLYALGTLGQGELVRVAFVGDPFSELLAHFVASGKLPDLAALSGPLLALPLLALPLIYFSTAWTFAPFLVIDRGLGPLEALTLSRRVAHRRWFKLFFLNLAFIPLLIAGAFCFLVGIFVVLALSLACYTVAYETAFGPAPGATETTAAEKQP